MTTSNASSRRPPCAAGSVRGPRRRAAPAADTPASFAWRDSLHRGLGEQREVLVLPLEVLHLPLGREQDHAPLEPIERDGGAAAERRDADGRIGHPPRRRE